MDNAYKNIKLIRKASGLTQGQLGHITNKSTPSISLFEKGAQPPDEIWMSIFLDFFQISEEQLRENEIAPFEAMLIAKRVENKLSKYRKQKETDPIADLSPVNEVKQPYKAIPAKNYRKQSHSWIGQKIDELLSKHKTNRTHYANDRLGISVRTLQRVISGEIAPDFYLVATIAQDHAESLDFFREGQLPKGHMITEISLLKQRVADLEKIIEHLESGYQNVIH